jgi:hypothetical protein
VWSSAAGGFTGDVSTSALHRPLDDVPEVRLGICVAVSFVCATLLHVVEAGPWAGAVTTLLVVAVGATTLPLLLAAGLGATGWGFVTGFVVNTGGQLTFDPADLVRLTLMVSAAVLAAAAVSARG